MNSAVIFDFDGTLFFGTLQLNLWCFQRALEAMGLPPPDDAAIRTTNGLTFPQIARLITGSADEAVLAEFGRQTFRFVPQYIARQVRPDAAMCAILDELRAMARLAVCSNATKDYLMPMLEALDFAPRLDMIWAHREGLGKAEAIPRVMAALDASRAVFVGDRLEDVQAARAAGIPVVGVRNRDFPSEVDGADQITENPREMSDAILAILSR